MLFMGEEYGETNPFLFFCEFSDPNLIEGVRRGRKRDYGLRGEVPDPQAEETFRASRLSWNWQNVPARKRMRDLYRELILLRKEIPALRESGSVEAKLRLVSDSPILTVSRSGGLNAFFNLGNESISTDLFQVRGRVVWRSEAGVSDGKLCGFETLLAGSG